jgi:hypothetical protein
MRDLPLTPEIEAVAKRVVWFEPPQQAVADPIRFLAYAMTYGDHEDMSILRRHLSNADLQEALANAPAGIFDGRSWAYWNLMVGNYPAPPMPERSIPNSDGNAAVRTIDA